MQKQIAMYKLQFYMGLIFSGMQFQFNCNLLEMLR